MRIGVNSLPDTGALRLLLAYRGTVRIAAAKFHDLQGCVFKILEDVNQNSVSLHQAKKSDSYINSWKARRLCGCWENKRTLPINLCYKIETSGTLCSSFDFSGGCGILAEARMTFTFRVFQGENSEQGSGPLCCLLVCATGGLCPSGEERGAL